MSNDIAIFKGGLPAYLKDAVDPVTSSLAGGTGGGMRRISIKGGVFRELVGGEEVRLSEERAMNIIIINAAPHVSRTYYDKTYTEGVVLSPACWSADGQRPDESAEKKQSLTCLNCPQNIKGSGQENSRACRHQRRLAVIIEGDENENVYQLVLPAKSIFGDGEKNKMPLNAYAKFLQNNGVPIIGVVTEMRFDTSSATPKVTFKPVRPVTSEEYETVQRLMKSDDAIKAITMTVAQTDNVKTHNEEFEQAQPKAKNAIAKPKVAEPEPQAEEFEESEPEVEQPKKVATKKPAPVVQESSLGDLVNEWDDV